MIDRGRFRHHEELRVWVQAKTRHGSAKSPEVVFYPAHISESYSTKSHSIFILLGATGWGSASNHALSKKTNQIHIILKIMNNNRFCCPWLFLVRPPPPIIQQNQDDAFDILWTSFCSDLGFSAGKCSVQYRTEADQDWHEVFLFSVFPPNYQKLTLLCKFCSVHVHVHVNANVFSFSVHLHAL